MLRRLHRRLALREQDAGFSLVEVMAAMMIFAILSIGVIGGITSSLVLTRDSRSRTTALNLATQAIDVARGDQDILDVDSSNPSVPLTQTVGGTVYTITQKVNWVTSDGTSSSCGTSGTGVLAFKHIGVTVDWSTRPASAKPVSIDTLLSPSSSINDPTLGTIAVKVQGATGTGKSGVGLSVTSNTGQTLTFSQPAATDNNGCTYALKVAPGMYTVAITSSGGIDATLSTTPSQQVSVAAGNVTSANFQYDTVARLATTYANGTSTLPTNMPTSVGNAALKFGVASVTSSSSIPVFPFTDGYTIVAGVSAPTTAPSSCLSADPANWTTAAPDGAVGGADTVYAAKPGSTTVVTVPMGLVQLPLLGSLTVTAVSVAPVAGSGDPGCAAAPTYTFPLLPGNRIALPYGTYALYTAGIVPLVGAQPVTRGTATGNIITLDPRTVQK